MSIEYDEKKEISKQLSIEELSDHYKTIIISYFKFCKSQTDLHIKEIESAFTNVKKSRF